MGSPKSGPFGKLVVKQLLNKGGGSEEIFVFTTRVNVL